MTDAYDPAPLAMLLAEAWRSGIPLERVPDALTPRVPADGYAVQNRFVQELGYPVIGWKLGGGSANAKRLNGTNVPLVGQLLGPGAYRCGDKVTMPGHRSVVVEFEIAFIFQEDPPSDLADDEALSCV